MHGLAFEPAFGTMPVLVPTVGRVQPHPCALVTTKQMSTPGLTVSELLSRLQSGQLTSVELTQACLDQITRHDSQVGAFLSIEPEK